MTETVFPNAENIDIDAAESLFYHEAGLKATWAISRLAVAALSFLFGSFLFAYFYLRSINSHGLWHPHGAVDPHAWAGALVMALVVGSAATQTIALQRIKAGNKSAWQWGAGAALVLGAGAVGLMVWQLETLPFPAGASGFDSVFTAFTPVYLIIALVSMIWLEILVARAAGIPAAFFVEQPPSYADTFTVQQFQARLSAFTVVWNYLAAVAIVFWVLFYLL
jgi:heme/copper-type cytochrome/quinol oxidase subunit 3